MKAIRIVCLLAMGFFQQIRSQTQQKEMAEEKPRYHVVSQKTAPNNKWTVFRKGYQENIDTIALVDHKDLNGTKLFTGAKDYYFTKASNLLLLKKNGVDVINTTTGVVKSWNNVVKSQYLKSENMILMLHQNDASKNDLEQWSEDRLISTYKNVDQFFVVNDQLFFVRLTNDNESYLFSCEQPYIPVLKTTGKIVNCSWQNEKESIWITENLGKRDLVYTDGNGQVSYLNKDIIMDFQGVRVSKIKNSSKFLVKLSYTKANNQTEIPDIWYTGDRNLESKFHGGSAEMNMLWNPSLHVAEDIGEGELQEVIDIGNAGYLLSFDPKVNQNYVAAHPDYDFYRFNVGSKEKKLLGRVGSQLIYGSKGRYFLSDQDGKWNLYDMDNGTVKKLEVEDRFSAYFSEEEDTIIFEDQDGVLRYEIAGNDLMKVPMVKDYKTNLLNGITSNYDSSYLIARKKIYHNKQPGIYKLYNDSGDLTAIVSLDKNKIRTIVKPTRQRLDSFVFDKNTLSTYITQDYNQPPQINLWNGKSSKIIYHSNKDDSTVLKIRSERIGFTNSEGIRLTGILYYPMVYDENIKYPMIVGIYQRQSMFANKYLSDRPYDMVEDFNVRSYISNSYFVFFPDIVFGKKGTGFSALDCVHNALDALKGYEMIDFKKVGLIGHSHGGYQTNFMATHSDRFAAYASGAGNSDLVRSYFSYNYQFLRPFYYQFENGQYKMPGSFEDYKDLYINNSPIYSVSNVNAPVLLWAGMKDKNIDWNQVMEFYIGLKRNNKNAVALFYPDEAHGFFRKSNQVDLAGRVKDWFDHYLKNAEKAGWIK